MPSTSTAPCSNKVTTRFYKKNFKSAQTFSLKFFKTKKLERAISLSVTLDRIDKLGPNYSQSLLLFTFFLE